MRSNLGGRLIPMAPSGAEAANTGRRRYVLQLAPLYSRGSLSWQYTANSRKLCMRGLHIIPNQLGAAKVLSP